MKVPKPMFRKQWMSPAMFAMLLIILYPVLLYAAKPNQTTNLPVGVQTSRVQTSRVQQCQTQHNAQDTVKNFTGEWKLKTSAKFSGQRFAAIDKAVAQMGRFKRGRARDMLKKMTSPPQQIVITDSGTQIEINRDGLKATVPTNGQAVTIKREAGSIEMQATRGDGKLTIVSKTANATQTSVFELSEDGRSLTQQIRLTSDKLKLPIEFTSRFERRNR